MLQTKLFKQTFGLLVVVGILNFLATFLYLLWSLPGFDKLLHFLSGVFVSMTVFIYFQYNPIPKTKSDMIQTAIVATFSIGIVWEIYELYFGITFFSDGIIYITDTISDFVMDLLGAYAGALYAFKLISENK